MSAFLTLSETTLPMSIGGGYVVKAAYADAYEKLLKRNLTKVDDTIIPEDVISFSDYLFQYNSYLTDVDLMYVTSVGINTFASCALTTISMPSLTSAGMRAFAYNPMTEISLPSLTSIGTQMFQSCTLLQKATFPAATEIERQAFYGCTNFDTLILSYNGVVTWTGTGMFTGTKIELGEGYIYVPAGLVEEYQAAEGWSDFSSQIRAISELEVE